MQQLLAQKQPLPPVSLVPRLHSSKPSSPAGKTGQAAADAFNTAISGAAKRAVGSTGLDFGKWTLTMGFQAGRAGRKATEFTFQATADTFSSALGF
jgi:hypothetical protein